MDVKHLVVSFQGLIAKTASDEHELIQLLKTLNEAILSCKKKTTLFASRQGKLLKDAKVFLTRPMNQNVREMCEFFQSLC